MAGRQLSAEQLLLDVPAHQRGRVLSGMRWTVWLSCVAVPCGAGINLLLARTGPEVIGIYGLLSVYIGLLIAFLYFGGDQVVVKFTPECSSEERASFLASYLAVVFTLLGGWMVFAWLCPGVIEFALGHQTGRRLDFILLLLAPAPILFYVAISALKGMLEIRLSQLLHKTLTIGSMAVYGALFVFGRQLLVNHAVAVVWGVYLGLTALLAAIGSWRIFQLCGRPRLRFHLPSGFWQYATDIQVVGVVSFFSARLDYLLVFNFGGLAMLGRYVAVMAVATIIPMLQTFFADTLLPSLTNTLAERNRRGAGQLFLVHMRLLILVTVAGGSAVMLLAVPAAVVMGSEYRSVEGLIALMAMFQTIGGPGAYGGTLLSSVGRPRRALWSGVLRVIVFVVLFLVSWRHWRLAGVVMAYGTALVLSNIVLMWIARRTAPYFPSIAGLWLKASVISGAVGAAVLWWMPLGPVTGILIWVGAMAIFLGVAGYRLAEIRALLDIFMPGSATMAEDVSVPRFEGRAR